MSEPIYSQATRKFGSLVYNLFAMSILNRPLIITGSTPPTDGLKGFAPGCLFLRTSGNGVGTTMYVNEGSATSCDFNAK